MLLLLFYLPLAIVRLITHNFAINIETEEERKRTRGKKDKTNTIMMTVKKYNYIEKKARMKF